LLEKTLLQYAASGGTGGGQEKKKWGDEKKRGRGVTEKVSWTRAIIKGKTYPEHCPLEELLRRNFKKSQKRRG